MGAWEKVLGLGGAAFVLYGISAIKKDIKEQEQKKEETQKRKSKKFNYPENLPAEKFEEIVKQSIKPIKRKITDIYVKNGVVYGTVLSQSGLSEWTFTLDFNDYGKLTGTFWLTSGNNDSKLPERLGAVIQSQINKIMSNDMYIERKKDESETESDTDIDKETTTLPTKPTKPQKNHWASTHKLAITFLIILIFVTLTFGPLILYEYQKRIPIGYDEEALLGLDYREVVQKLEKEGFTYIVTEEIPNLTLAEEFKSNLVTDVKLEENIIFDKGTKYAYDKQITVVYHSLSLCKPPLTSKDAKGTNYNDVVNNFNNSGFVNIKTNVLYDIITGWVTDDGEVKSITINGEEDFNTFDQFRPDAEVIITYHTYTKNNPDK
jgi:hypothetical protein